MLFSKAVFLQQLSHCHCLVAGNVALQHSVAISVAVNRYIHRLLALAVVVAELGVSLRQTDYSCSVGALCTCGVLIARLYSERLSLSVLLVHLVIYVRPVARVD